MPRQCDPLLLLPSNAISARGVAPFRDRPREHHPLNHQARWTCWLQDSWRVRFHTTNQVYLIIHSSYSIFFLLSSRDFIELLFSHFFSLSRQKIKIFGLLFFYYENHFICNIINLNK